MYDRFHKCVLENKILYPKKYGFQVGHSKNYLYKVFLFYIFKTCTTHYRSGRTEVFCANAVLKLMINNVNKILGKLSESKFASQSFTDFIEFRNPKSIFHFINIIPIPGKSVFQYKRIFMLFFSILKQLFQFLANEVPCLGKNCKRGIYYC